MNIKELKKKCHKLIDNIDDPSLLENFNELLKIRSSTSYGHLWNTLSKKERKELLLVFEESEDPNNLKSHEKMKNKFRNLLFKKN